jgi:hypothetical protein
MTDQSGAFPEKWPDDSMLEAAWGLIANANEGDWDKALPEWREAAVRWRAAYHRTLERPRPAPPDTLESVTAWLNANDWWDFSTVELATRILKRLRGGAAQPPPSAPDDDPMSAEFLEKYESLGHWCPNGDRVRPYSFAVCSMCMGKGAIQIVQLRGVPREETNPHE